MARRKRPTKKAAAKRPVQQNSAIQASQRAAQQRRIQRAQQAAERGSPASSTQKDPRTGLPIPQPSGPVRPGDPVGRGAQLAAQGKSDGDKPPAPVAQGLSQSANKIAGLANEIMKHKQAEVKKPNPLADASVYGDTGKKRAERLTMLMNDRVAGQRRKLTQAGKAVWMGAQRNRAHIRNQGPERMEENGKDYSVQAVGDDVRSTDELMSWLSEEDSFNKIREAANKAGIDAQTYDDVAKVWQSVVNQAASTYSTTGKKVTPWALLQLRGKTMVGGKPGSKTTTSKTIDEMDPAEAKVMIRNAAGQALGRDPTKEEIEDFIAKAQTIARANPNVTTTTTNYGFDGEATSQSSISKGGGDAVTAQTQEAAMQQLKQSEDYAGFQGAGVYMPWLEDALSSPI